MIVKVKLFGIHSLLTKTTGKLVTEGVENELEFQAL